MHKVLEHLRLDRLIALDEGDELFNIELEKVFGILCKNVADVEPVIFCKLSHGFFGKPVTGSGNLAHPDVVVLGKAIEKYGFVFDDD